MLFDEEGINLKYWQKFLEEKGEVSDVARFVDKMKSLNLPNSVFVDCTASREVVGHYEYILNASISIATPNKIASSGNQVLYKKLKDTAFRHGIKFMYETNVGAGLPVITTLNDLILSGDRIRRIEGVLSGTLSYIFNNFTSDSSFSSVVREAMEKGYTEPDPRDDLNGLDVARKILILTREVGYSLELGDVEIENLLPQACLNASTVEDFFHQLEEADDHFEELRQDAESRGEKLRYIAVMDEGKASVRLMRVGIENPFYGLSGSDNMIVFVTDRYWDRPLVVKGPGAGAEVTAAGVFAELISLSHFLG
jgi:aspartokinase/homoserine dehydrogenase 1